jgi:hypothetical protein
MMLMKWMLGFAAAMITLPATAAEMYKWLDAEGKVHYSDQQPPADARKQETLRAAARTAARVPAPAGGSDAAPGTSPAPKTTAEQEMEFRKRRVEAAEAEAKKQKETQAAADKQRNCTQSKARVAALEKGGRITRLDAAGEQVFLNDAEIGQALTEARRTAESWCN